jgi:hypothetical protein
MAEDKTADIHSSTDFGEGRHEGSADSEVPDINFISTDPRQTVTNQSPTIPVTHQTKKFSNHSAKLYQRRPAGCYFQ